MRSIMFFCLVSGCKIKDIKNYWSPIYSEFVTQLPLEYSVYFNDWVESIKMNFCNNLSLSTVWHDRGVSSCFYETVTSLSLAALILIFGSIEIMAYRCVFFWQFMLFANCWQTGLLLTSFDLFLYFCTLQSFEESRCLCFRKLSLMFFRKYSTAVEIRLRPRSKLYILQLLATVVISLEYIVRLFLQRYVIGMYTCMTFYLLRWPVLQASHVQLKHKEILLPHLVYSVRSFWSHCNSIVLYKITLIL